ncbi:MAG: hypothetical protein ACXWFZ_13430 [Nitrososphaeraceae archaeon]
MGFFDGPFYCRDHDFKTNNANEFETHMTTIEHLVIFGSNGTCTHCNKKGLYFHNVVYVGQPLLWELICKDCSPKVNKKANAFEDPLEPILKK